SLCDVEVAADDPDRRSWSDSGPFGGHRIAAGLERGQSVESAGRIIAISIKPVPRLADVGGRMILTTVVKVGANSDAHSGFDALPYLGFGSRLCPSGGLPASGPTRRAGYGLRHRRDGPALLPAEQQVGGRGSNLDPLLDASLTHLS